MLRVLGGADIRVVDNLNDAAAELDRADNDRVVVIGADVPFIEAEALASHLHTVHPDAALVLVRHADEHDVTDEALAAGIVEVVVSGDVDGLQHAHARALGFRDDHRPADEEDGEIAVVFSPKGGAGKTLVSTNLALALNRCGYHTCLVDLDLEFGDVAVCLRLSPARNIADAATLDLSDDASIAALVTGHESRLDCVLAPINPGDADRVPVRVVSELLAQLRTRYDYIVVDTPSQFSEHVLEALDAAHHHVLVTTPEIPALKNTRLTLDMLELLGYDDASRSIVVNRADPKVGLSTADVQSALRASVDGELPATSDVPRSINSGNPLLLEAPQHPFSMAVRELAAHRISNDTVPLVRKPRRRFALGRGRSA
jgi:pilus assembly protein CpaE